MFAGNRGIVLTILMVVLISVAAMIGVAYSLVQSLEAINFGKVDALSPDREVEVIDRGYNYNFAVPNEKVQEEVVEPETKEVVKEVKEEKVEEKEPEAEVEEEEIPVYNYNFKIPKIKNLPQVKSIQIPTISYNSPVVKGGDADTGIDKGAWYYPSNHPAEGEAIFLCHRRYFTLSDPKSCWNLDKVKTGDAMYLNFRNGTQYTYKVISVSVAGGDDISIYHPSNDQVIKLISCAKEDGHIGSDSHRIVVIAKKVG